MDEVNNATHLGEDHTRTYRSVCVRINFLAQDRPDILFAAKVDGSAKHLGVGYDRGMRAVLVVQAESGAENRDATSSWYNLVEN